MLFKCDCMFSVISKGVQYEFNRVHQGKNGRNTLKNAENEQKNSGNKINKKDPMDLFTYLDGRYSTHEQQQHLYKIFGSSKKIIVYLGGGGTVKIQWKAQKIGAKIDKDTEKRQFPSRLSQINMRKVFSTILCIYCLHHCNCTLSFMCKNS